MMVGLFQDTPASQDDIERVLVRIVAADRDRRIANAFGFGFKIEGKGSGAARWNGSFAQLANLKVCGLFAGFTD
jgi:hypothetical protein